MISHALRAGSWRSSTKRQGYSLVEMLVVMTVSAALMVIAIGWIHQSLKLATLSRNRQIHHQNLLALAHQLRTDTQCSQSMVIDDDSKLVLRSADKGMLVYAIESAGVRRVHHELGESKSQEFYRLSSGSKAAWDASELPGWITLRIQRSRGFKMSRSALRSDDPNATENIKRDANPIEPPVDLIVRAGIRRFPNASLKTKGSK